VNRKTHYVEHTVCGKLLKKWMRNHGWMFLFFTKKSNGTKSCE